MKYNLLLCLLLLLLNSCIFSKKVAFISERRSMPERQVYCVSEDSIKLIFDGQAFLKFVMKSPCSDSIKNRLRSYLALSPLAFDSLETFTRDDFYCRDFLIKQLNKGNVYLLDLHTGQRIRHIKKTTNYYKDNFFTGRKLYVDYSKGKKLVYEERYLIIDF